MTVPARPAFIGSPGCVRFKAWIWLFSSQLSTTACSGGFSYLRTVGWWRVFVDPYLEDGAPQNFLGLNLFLRLRRMSLSLVALFSGNGSLQRLDNMTRILVELPIVSPPCVIG